MNQRQWEVEPIEDVAEVPDVVVSQEVDEDTEEESTEIEIEPAEEESTDSQEDLEVSEVDESEVAADSVVTGLLETVERGALEQGDRVISDDGSFYDSYPIEGQAGESFNILSRKR